MQTLFLQVGMSSSMKVFSHSANSLNRNPYLHYKVFCPAIDIDLPTPVQHSLAQPSSPTRHNAPKPPANQPSSPTRHNALESPADQPSSPTPGSLTPILDLLQPTFLFDDPVAYQPHLPGFKTT